ncbi:MAG: acetyl-CoA carboxylase carboxyltransferase subunit beta, partial [Zetaproteobacteria bacterium]
MNWLTKLLEGPKSILKGKSEGPPEGLWRKCEGCGEMIYSKALVRNLYVCPKCGRHERAPVLERASQLFDEGFEELDTNLKSADPLAFRDKKRYRDRLKEADKKAGKGDAVRNFFGTIEGVPVSASIFSFAYMGGSMGSVAGEKIVRAIERAMEKRAGFLLVAASGGARMQEGILSLMQMAKTADAARRLHDAKIPFISLLTDPTMGGVSASIAWLGDVVIAEPGALIGFAGPRVIKETVRQELPEGFQRAEFLLEHGLIDDV